MSEDIVVKIVADASGVAQGVESAQRSLSGLSGGAQRAGQAAAASFNNMSISAAQTAAAMRQVPAQFTDIVTSLQGGQKPLTVLLQQGGQLKDMFGGVGNAAKAMGSYVVGLLNPLTLTAAAIGGIGYAAFEGAKEATALSKALILSGNAAGMTTSQLIDMSTQVAAATGATQSAVTDVLGALATTGKVAAGSMEGVAASITRMTRSGGAEVDEMVKAFAELGKSPVEASKKLDEQYNYLTLSTYRQIKALEEQGHQAEAAALAQKAFADASDGMASKLEANLGSIERGWRSLVDVIKAGVSVAKSVGRELSLEQQIAQLENERARYLDPNSGQAGTAASKAKYVKETIDPKLAPLYEQVEAQKQYNQAKAEENRIKTAGIKLDELKEKFASKEIQRQRELAKATEILNASNASAADRQQVLGAINEKYHEKAKAAKKQEISDYQKLMQTIGEKIAVQEQELASSEKMTEGEKMAAVVMKQLESGKISLTAAEKKAVLTALEHLSAINRQNAAMEQQNRSIREWVQALDSESQSLDAKLVKAKEELALIGASAEGKELIKARTYELAAAEKELEAAALQANLALGSVEQQNIIEAYGKAIESSLAQAAKLRDLANTETQMAARKVAVQQAEESTRAWKKFSADIESSLTDALMRGFENGNSFGKNFVDTLKNTIKTAALKIVVQAIVSPVSQGLTGVAQSMLGISALTGNGNNSGGLINAASLGSSAYNLYSGGYAGLYNNFATSGVGSMLGLSSSIPASMAAEMGGVAAGTQLTGLGSSVGSAIGAGGSAAGGAAAGGAAAGSSLYSIPVIGWILAGLTAGSKFYKEGFTQDNAGKGGILGEPTIWSATSFLKDIGISESVATLLTGNSAINKVFGYKNKEVKEAGVFAAFDDQGVMRQPNAAVNYIDWEQKGGLLRRDKGGTEMQFMGQDGIDRLNAMFGAAQLAFADLLTTVGEAPRQLSGFSYMFRQSLATEAEVAAVMKSMADAMAENLLPEFKEFQNEGESLSETAVRLSQEIKSTNVVLELLGKNAQEAFGAAGLASIRMRDSLIEAFGSLDALNSELTSYYNDYFTAEEKKQRAVAELSDQFGALGLALPDSRAGFRSLVEGLDLSNDAGQKTFVSLMQLSEAFASITETTDAAAEAQRQAAEAQRQAAEAQAALMQEIIDKATAAQRSILIGRQEAAIAATQGKIEDIAAAFGDTTLTMEQLLRPTQTVSEQLADLVGNFSNLETSLNGLLGLTAATPLESLQTALGQRNSLQDYRASLGNVIFDTRLAGQDKAGQAAMLKTLETQLWSALDTAADPASVAQKLQSTMLRRIELESASAAESAAGAVTSLIEQQKTAIAAQIESTNIQIEALGKQIDAAERLKDYVADLANFVGSLKYSEISPLNPAAQLSAAQSEYERILAGARSGDSNAQGQLTSSARDYLDEARSYYASSADYAAIFGSVVGTLEDLGLNMDASAAQAEQWQIQYDLLKAQAETLKSSDISAAQTAENTAASAELNAAQLDGLIRLDEKIGTVLTSQQSNIDSMVENLRLMIEQQKEQAEGLEMQLAAMNEVLTALTGTLAEQTDTLEQMKNTSELIAVVNG